MGCHTEGAVNERVSRRSEERPIAYNRATSIRERGESQQQLQHCNDFIAFRPEGPVDEKVCRRLRKELHPNIK